VYPAVGCVRMTTVH